MVANYWCSLVLSTKGRVAELEQFLAALAPQSEGVQLIISDQNDDDRLLPVVDKGRQSGIHIEYLKSTGGLSAGRNAGLALCVGDIVGFPDDDCVYSLSVLSEVGALFRANPAIGLVGLPAEDQQTGAQLVATPRHATGLNARYLPVFSPTLFVRRTALGGLVGPFDASLGVGASYFGAGEETDLVLRLLAQGVVGVFWPNAVVFHPAKEDRLSVAALRRKWCYGRGAGKVMLKHRALLGLAFWSMLGAALGGRALRALLRGDARGLLHLSYGAGTVMGMIRHKWGPGSRSLS